MIKKTILFIFILIIFGIGVITGPALNFNKKSNNGTSNSFKAGWDAAMKRFKENGIGPMIDNEIEIKNLQGRIEEIKENKINLKLSYINPLSDPDLDVRIIEIDKAKIYKMEQKDQETFQKEIDEFNKKIKITEKTSITSSPSIQELTPLLTPPNILVKKEISAADLRVGQQITVTSQNNIKNSKNFSAEEIVIESIIEPGV